MLKLANKPLTQSDLLVDLLGQIVAAGKEQNMTAADIAIRAGLAPQTISRMKARQSGDFGAVANMAAVVGLKLTLTAKSSKAGRIAAGAFFE